MSDSEMNKINPSAVTVRSACGACEVILRMRRDIFSKSILTVTALVGFSNLRSVSVVRIGSPIKGKA